MVLRTQGPSDHRTMARALAEAARLLTLIMLLPLLLLFAVVYGFGIWLVHGPVPAQLQRDQVSARYDRRGVIWLS